MLDMRVQSNASYFQADKLYQQQRSQSAQSASPEDISFLQTLNEKEEQLQVAPSGEAVLSVPERATLHVLFGSEKPDISSLYGKNNNAQLYKGHLLDVAG